MSFEVCTCSVANSVNTGVGPAALLTVRILELVLLRCWLTSKLQLCMSYASKHCESLLCRVTGKPQPLARLDFWHSVPSSLVVAYVLPLKLNTARTFPRTLCIVICHAIMCMVMVMVIPEPIGCKVLSLADHDNDHSRCYRWRTKWFPGY